MSQMRRRAQEDRKYEFDFSLKITDRIIARLSFQRRSGS